MRFVIRVLVSAAAVLLVPVMALAQGYPAKTIRIIIPFPPGGATDLLGRLVALSLSERIGQSVIGENRTGSGGNIGADYTAKAAPDGYTIMVGGIPHAINVTLFSKRSYEFATDLAPIVNVATFPSMIAAHPSMPVKSVKDVIALAQKNPGGLNFGAATGSPNHLIMELIGVMAKVKMVHIAYKGAGPAIIDLVGGHLHVSSIGFPGAMPHVKTGRLRPVAVTSAQRSDLLPELPTVAESGLPGFDVTSWYGIFGPAGLPREIITRLNTEIRAIAESPDVRKRLAAVGAEVKTNSPEEYAKLVRSEIDRWATVVKASGARAN